MQACGFTLEEGKTAEKTMVFALIALIYPKAKRLFADFSREVKGMSTTDEQYWNLLTKFKSMQLDSKIGVTRCPRCGRDTMRSDIVLNARSRYIDVYICSACGTEEAMLDLDGEHLPLKDWYLSRLLPD